MNPLTEPARIGPTIRVVQPSEGEYTSHLCTFLGREANVRLLHQYIERALSLNAVDNYWMIDMTRCVSDHEYIFKEYQRLSKKFPNRVHIYNNETRKRELNTPEKIKKSIGSWKVFYQFLDIFSDNDVIAKCDDDTLYLDIETLRAAFKFRWNNRQPYLMHANCINNGITTYHQHKKGIWNTNETDIYPSCGLTGPLFSFPEIACMHHKTFTTDLLKTHDNIQKYQLNENILFQQRVSINFIFMLGTDRQALSKIDLQDEYNVSCKLPQNADRANCIIGDFTVSHHTYGTQEHLMKKMGTYEDYAELASKLAIKNDYINKPINDSINEFITLNPNKCEYIAKYPSNPNTKTIQHVKSGMYISLRGKKIEKIKLDKKWNKIQTGNFILQSELYGDKNPQNAVLMDIDLDKPTLLEFTNSNKILRTPSSRKLHTKDIIPTHMTSKFFQGGYKTELVNFIKCTDKYYKIQSNAHPSFYLSIDNNKNTDKMHMKWKRGNGCMFKVTDISSNTNSVTPILIHRCDDDLLNDGTYYTIKADKRKIFKAREYYWMVDHYLWELVPHKNDVYYIKLLADNIENKYLTVNKSNFEVGLPDKWTNVGSILMHQKTGISIQFSKPE